MSDCKHILGLVLAHDGPNDLRSEFILIDEERR